MSQTLLVAGSGTGLGRAAGMLFAQRGWKVVATMRHPGKATELASVSGATVIPLDVTDRARSKLPRVRRPSSEAWTCCSTMRPMGSLACSRA